MKSLAFLLFFITSGFYFSQTRLDSLQGLLRHLKVIEESGTKSEITSALNNVGAYYFENKNYKAAKKYLERSLNISRELGLPESIRNLSQKLIVINKAEGNYKEALEMTELFKRMSDSLNHQQIRKASLRKQMQFEYEKKEQLARMEQDQKDLVAAEELKRHKQQRNYFIAGFILVLVLALFIFRTYRQKQKASIIIIAKKEEAEKQKALIEEKQKEILDSIRYAKRIQTALITSEKYIEKKLDKLL